MYGHLDSNKQYKLTYHNDQAGVLCAFLRQLCYRLSMGILQSCYLEYVYDPSLLDKFTHKDKSIKKSNINTLKNKSKITKDFCEYFYRYVNQKCKNSYEPLL